MVSETIVGIEGKKFETYSGQSNTFIQEYTSNIMSINT